VVRHAETRTYLEALSGIPWLPAPVTSARTVKVDDPHFFLLVEDDQRVAQAIRRILADGYGHAFALAHATTLTAGLDRLRTGAVSAMLLDLRVADGQGLVTFERAHAAAPHVPILVLCATVDEGLARQAVEHGAWEYALTDDLRADALTQALGRMTIRVRAEESASVQREQAQVTLNSIGDAVLCTDNAGCVTFLNTVAENLTGWTDGEAAGRPFADVFRIVDGLTRLPAPNPMELAVALKTTVGLTANCVLSRRDGVETAIEDSAAPIRDRFGRVTGAVMVFRDVSVARAAALAVSHSAQHDVLTDLPNRTLFNDRLSEAIVVAGRRRTRFAVLYLDVDRFKEINDSLGHATGDRLLQSIAQRLLHCVRGSDTVSRRGGDEFVILLSDIATVDDAAVTANAVIAAVSTPHRIGGLELRVTATVGVSLYPEHGDDAETLINNADDAMYSAKGTSASRCHFFESSMNVRAIEWRSVQVGLHDALTRRDFELHYQPKVDLDTGTVVGAEALIRWRHPDRGLVLPDAFVPIAENSGLIVPIGQWVVREACRQARTWQDAGLPPTPVAVNISALEFRSAGFLGQVQAILAETGLQPRHLELELTESVLMQYADATVGMLQTLKEMGVQVAIDDFGTGYSSLSYLRQFPMAALKIDRSFVREITGDLDSAPIVTAVIGLGKSLGHRVIAEGVETPAQLAFLRAHHCPEGQGFLFSPPVTADRFGHMLARGLPAPLLD
jgi:diguanylate cyclase (GGDEF)-like protein/PAS domain S-box-containing protein